MTAATIQTYFSFLKTFTGWIGKPNLMKPIGCCFDDPKLYHRSYTSPRPTNRGRRRTSASWTGSEKQSGWTGTSLRH